MTARAVVRGVLCCVVSAVFCGTLVRPSEAAKRGTERARARAVAALDAGQPELALATIDSLLRLDPSDLSAAWLAARAEEAIGRLESARCRFLELEGVAPDTDEGRSAARERMRLDSVFAKRFSDFEGAESARGLGDFEGAEGPALADRGSGGALLFPLDDLGQAGGGANFGLAWSYLMSERLAGSLVCPAPVSVALLVQERLASGRGIHLPDEVERLPVNTVPGLWRRLALLPDAAGRSYLATTAPAGDEPDGDRLAFENALVRFQTDHALVASGEADLATQRAVEEAVVRWLLTPPPSLRPEQVAQAAELGGARYVLRGTYRREGDEIRLQMGWLDEDGRDAGLPPFAATFAADEAPAVATRAADAFLRAVGDARGASTPSDVPLATDLELVTTGLLLADRGAERLALDRWEGLDANIARWPLAARRLEALRDPFGADAAFANAHEARVRDRWLTASPLPSTPQIEAILLDVVGASVRPATPGPYELLTESGRVLIRVEGP